MNYCQEEGGGRTVVQKQREGGVAGFPQQTEPERELSQEPFHSALGERLTFVCCSAILPRASLSS